jgi:hypothetical protein
MEYLPYGMEEGMSDQETVDLAGWRLNGEVLLH